MHDCVWWKKNGVHLQNVLLIKPVWGLIIMHLSFPEASDNRNVGLRFKKTR